jgi:peptidoglycan/LPS O-acetylase OafA/YrhL
MMTNTEEYPTQGNRFHFLDNLRTTIIFLVVLYHAGGVYESSGVWAPFWLVDDPATNDIVGIFNLMFDVFMMPTMFFISGYLTPPSLQKKGEWSFMKSRFTRLIIPWTIAVFTLIPFFKVIFLYSRNLLQENWTTYFHFSNGPIHQNWLWFLPLLFVFNLLYLLLVRVRLAPERVSFTIAVAAVFFIGLAYTLGFDMLDARGWTYTPFVEFQKERLLMYFLVFLLGTLAYQQNVFASETESKTLYNVASYSAWLPITTYIIFLLVPFVAEDGVLISRVVDRLIVWLSFYLTLLCMVYILIESFRRYLNKPARLWNELNKNSYHVYIIHVIVIGVFGLLLLNLALPSLLKYLILVVSTIVVSNLIVSLIRQAATGMKTMNQRDVPNLGSIP